jgi:hypothetical protein
MDHSPALPAPREAYLTRAGLPKRRFSLHEKIEVLGLGCPREATVARLGDFRRIFAFRRTNAIITKVGKGPRAWTRLPGLLEDHHIVRHLLADRIPNLRPIWVGARSRQTSVFLCVDVDPVRTPEQILAQEYDPTVGDADDHAWLLRRISQSPPKPPFDQRCEQVERAFRRLGIPTDPRHLLIQPTPSGGRHYFLFFDARYCLEQYRGLLERAGLKHVTGEVEFFPSRTQGLRLPFGHIPGTPHNPNAWIQFTDDYRNGRIHRHCLAKLHDNLEAHQTYWSQRLTRKAQRSPPVQQRLLTKPPPAFPSNDEEPSVKKAPPAIARYRELIGRGLQSRAEAEELTKMGILLPGTRTAALKQLAAHWIWFRRASPEETAEILTDWAMSPRHASKDIAHDLTHGTTKVPRQIDSMCRWYELNKTAPDVASARSIHEFAQGELDALRQSLVNLTGEERISQAEFLLHFLRFAKRHGTAAKDQTGWDAAVHVNKVIKRWPGCSHRKYLERVHHATTAGMLTRIKGAWHRANGPGRATTYRLSVPVVPEIEWVLTYEGALEALTKIGPSSGAEEEPGEKTASNEEQTHASRPSQSDSGGHPHPRGGLSTALPPPCPGAGLDSGPRQRDPQPDATPGLHRRDPQGLRTTSTINAEPILFS